MCGSGDVTSNQKAVGAAWRWEIFIFCMEGEAKLKVNATSIFMFHLADLYNFLRFIFKTFF